MVLVGWWVAAQAPAAPQGVSAALASRLTSPSNTAVSVWPLTDPLLDWEILT
jgi:hypothetical protein